MITAVLFYRCRLRRQNFGGRPPLLTPKTPFPLHLNGAASRAARAPPALSIKIDGARYKRDYGQSDHSIDQGYNLSLYYKALQVLSKCLLEYLFILAHICCIAVVSFADNQKYTFLYSHDFRANLLYGDSSYSSNNTISD